MASKAVDPQDVYFHRNFLVRFYFSEIIKTSVRLAGLHENDVIFDFGCGKHQILRQSLSAKACETALRQSIPASARYFGYDIINEWGNIADYTKIRPSKIFALNVFEHLASDELENALANFRKMNRGAILITAIPFQNAWSRFLRALTNIHIPKGEHKQSFEGVNSTIGKYCEKLKGKKLYGLTEVAAWRFK